MDNVGDSQTVSSIRRAHRKSRGGCNQCKSRRIKCDEHGPPCYSCVARDLVCQYSATAELARRPQCTADPDRRVSTQSPASTDISEVHREERHLFELELTNLWATKTFSTFCHQQGQELEEDERTLWQQVMPKEALRHDYLLNSSFAVTSLHMASLTDDHVTREKYVRAAVEYHNASLPLFMQAWPYVAESSCRAIYVTSMGYFVLTMAMPHIDPLRGERQTVEQSIFSLLVLYKGPRRLLRLFGQQLSARPFGATLAKKDMRQYSKHDEVFLQALDRLRSINDSQYAKHFLNFHKANQLAILELQGCSTRFVNGVEMALVGWLMSLEDDFIELLQQRQNVAILIMMHWAVLLNRPTDTWWLLRSGRALVYELSESLSDLTKEEQDARDWCHLQVASRDSLAKNGYAWHVWTASCGGPAKNVA